MRVERIFCDAEGCEEDAEFRLTHEVLKMPKHAYDQTVVIDLCGLHAERFAISGRGGFNGPVRVHIDRSRT